MSSSKRPFFGLSSAPPSTTAELALVSCVTITAIAYSAAAKAQMERKLQRAAPPSLRLRLDIAAPRPVITPFTLRFEIDAEGARFDACSADTEAAADRILKAGITAGAPENADCTIGLGVPSPNWGRAVALRAKQLAGRMLASRAGGVVAAPADFAR